MISLKAIQQYRQQQQQRRWFIIVCYAMTAALIISAWASAFYQPTPTPPVPPVPLGPIIPPVPPVTTQFQPEIVFPTPVDQNNVSIPQYQLGTLLYFSISDPAHPLTEYIKSPNQIKWQIVPNSTNFRQVDNNLGVVFTSNEPAEFTLLVAIATSATPTTSSTPSTEPEVHLLSKQFTVGKLPNPPPTPPDPPNPPDPTPTPTPNPNPAPIADAGLRVLIIEEVDARQQLPRSQANLLSSASFRKFLNESCIKVYHGPNSTNPVAEWRLFDEDSSLDNESELWKKAFKRYQTATTRPSLPHLLISNGKSGFEGPLPKNEEEATLLIKKYILP